uniref:C-type lectin domain-containing protein n=1 Tax=Pelusios castaneus TaxID=367368 RepID=A0A8C8SAD1_9SAUR
ALSPVGGSRSHLPLHLPLPGGKAQSREKPAGSLRRWRSLLLTDGQVSPLNHVTFSFSVPSKHSSAALPCMCPDSWVGYGRKCYYFSEAEGNWTYSQSNCSSLGASLAIVNTRKDLAFMMRHKGKPHRWIGLRKELRQPWKWTNGTEFNNL